MTKQSIYYLLKLVVAGLALFTAFVLMVKECHAAYPLSVEVNVNALEIMGALYLAALAIMWGIRKAIKLMNRS